MPPLERRPWPTLGPEICDFIEDRLVHGPGDILGEKPRLTDEVRAWYWRVYEVYPRDHPLAGRRRFKEADLVRRKGWSKTEAAAWTAICEMDPEAPVRCDGFRRVGRQWVPVGRPLRDPYIPMVAYTEEQTEDLAYGAVYAILTHENCPLVDDYDAGLERTRHRRAPGQIKPLATAPGAREGARTTFQHFDEVHRFITPRLIDAHSTMLGNIPKRRAADAWSLRTTTAYKPGSGSVGETAHLHAEAVATGEVEDPSLYFDYLGASEHWDLEDPDQLEEAILEASGDAAAFADVPSIAGRFRKDPADGRRLWLNQPWGSRSTWISSADWAERARSEEEVPEGSDVVLGFWGGAARTSAGMMGATRDGHVFVVAHWEHLPGTLRIARSEVEEALDRARHTYEVPELVTSKVGGSGWISEIEDWEESGLPIVEIPINSPARMGPACTRFYTAATAAGEDGLTHDGHLALARHVARAQPTASVYGTYIRAPGPEEPIDLARAAVLAYERAMSEELEEDLVAMVIDPTGGET